MSGSSSQEAPIATPTPPTPVTIHPDTPTPHFDVDEMRRIFEAEQRRDDEQLNALLAEFDTLMRDFDVWSHAYISRRAIEDQMELGNMAQVLAKEEERNRIFMRSIVSAVEAYRQNKIDVSPSPTQD
ncbi:BQ2448_5449 [Microbotryum intermedium]|uniref:BQ2448_5449 protein n=1 Tax=Microbotryum intermedium TaxID=269621 RepID=A0A238F9I1_9BASI|nr:BQ2448_5449 [Microbotryum intermedium]